MKNIPSELSLKVLPELSQLHKQFLKNAFQIIGITNVSIHKSCLHINGKQIALVPMAEYPEYTNEKLLEMSTDELIDLATDFGFDATRYGQPTYEKLLYKYGVMRVRSWLKAFIYCSPHNHPVRCYAKARKSGKLVDLAKHLWIFLQIEKMSNSKYNILCYIKPVNSLLQTLELL